MDHNGRARAEFYLSVAACLASRADLRAHGRVIDAWRPALLVDHTTQLMQEVEQIYNIERFCDVSLTKKMRG